MLEQAMEYWTDAWQRSVLTLDALNERGNIHLAQAAKEVPNVLNFANELVLDGRKLPRPVNYGLVRIIPPDGAACRSVQAADRRRRSARGPRSGHRGHEARERNRRGDPRRPCLLLRRLFARADAWPDDRGRLPRRGGLRRGGRPAPPRCREQAHRHRQLPGRLADHDDGGDRPGPHGPDPGCGVAHFLLGWRARQEPHALSGRHFRRLVGDRAFRRRRRGQIRRREPHRQFRARQSREHLLDQGIQRLLQRRCREGALPLVRDLVGQPGPAERRRDAMDRRQSVRRQQAVDRADPHDGRGPGRSQKHQVANRRLLLMGRQRDPAAAGPGLGSRPLRQRRRDHRQRSDDHLLAAP